MDKGSLKKEVARLCEIGTINIENSNYVPTTRYGVYQITKELNTSKTVGTGKSKKVVYEK